MDFCPFRSLNILVSFLAHSLLYPSRSSNKIHVVRSCLYYSTLGMVIANVDPFACDGNN